MKIWLRIIVWLGCVILATSLFCLLFKPFGLMWIVFKFAIKLALPVGLFYLPFVFAFKDAEGARLRLVFASGVLIGPTLMLLLGLGFQLLGYGSGHTYWFGEGEDQGVFMVAFLAGLVGFLTTGMYVASLKLAHRMEASRA